MTQSKLEVNDTKITVITIDNKEYKNIKRLYESKNLRDFMHKIELAFTNLGEV